MWVSKNCEILLLQQLRITEDAKFNYEEYGEKQSKFEIVGVFLQTVTITKNLRKKPKQSIYKGTWKH